MKFVLYSLPFLFLAMLAQAQQSISYISFFPPANIVHNEVFLKQNIDSFSHDEVNGFGYKNGDEMIGSLILGAADDAHIHISTLTAFSDSATDKLVENFYADNFIKIISTGTNKGIVNNYIAIGDPNTCAGGSTNCNTIFISSGKIKSGLDNIDISQDKNIKAYVSDLTTVKNIGITTNTGKSKNFMADIPSGYKLVWCNLRLPGTEVCRKYLVALPDDSVAIGQCNGNGTHFCREPQDGN